MTVAPPVRPATSASPAPSRLLSVERAARPTSGAWAGRNREYDLLKEFVVAIVVVSMLTAVLALVFSSPDDPQVTLSTWSRAAPADFVATAAAELDGTSGSATYGAPYTHTPDKSQKLGPVSLEHLAGVTHPIDPAQDFVVRPLAGIAGDPALVAALAQWTSAGATAQQAWAGGYDAAIQKAPDTDPAKVAAGDYGPVPLMLNRLLLMAQGGGLDGALLLQGAFYQTDYTKPLLFIADGSYLADKASAAHLSGPQWGMMNETGNYPGQPWMWLYTFWYQVKPFSTSTNADALVWGVMALLTLVLVLVPYIPGLRSLPRHLGVHRLIWRAEHAAR